MARIIKLINILLPLYTMVYSYLHFFNNDYLKCLGQKCFGFQGILFILAQNKYIHKQNINVYVM